MAMAQVQDPRSARERALMLVEIVHYVNQEITNSPENLVSFAALKTHLSSRFPSRFIEVIQNFNFFKLYLY